MMLSSNLFASVGLLMVPSGVNAWCADANENIFGKTLVPKCSRGILSDQSPRFPPAIEGEAEMRSACRSLKGCGRNLETQSILFLMLPGMEPLYSGDAMINASLAIRRFLNSSAPGGWLST